MTTITNIFATLGFIFILLILFYLLDTARRYWLAAREWEQNVTTQAEEFLKASQSHEQISGEFNRLQSRLNGVQDAVREHDAQIKSFQGIKERLDAIQDCTKTHDEQIQDLMGDSQ